MNSTVAIIVTYNRREMLQQCLEKALGQTSLCDVLVLDNASTDDTAAYVQQLAEQTPNLYYQNTGANLGGAGGFSFGIEQAVARGYQYLWVMDDDCMPFPDALEQLQKADAQLGESYGWLSSQCQWMDGSLCQMNLQRCTPYRDIRGFEEALVSAEMASFVSLWLPARTVRHFGLPIKEFFIWTDDWEYTRRISRSQPCYAVRDSKVVHAMKTASVVNIATDSSERLSRYAYFYRNDVYLYRREGVQGWLWLIAKDVWHSVQVIAKGQWGKLHVIWKGFRDGVRFHPDPRGGYPEEPL